MSQPGSTKLKSNYWRKRENLRVYRFHWAAIFSDWGHDSEGYCPRGQRSYHQTWQDSEKDVLKHEDNAEDNEWVRWRQPAGQRSSCLSSLPVHDAAPGNEVLMPPGEQKLTFFYTFCDLSVPSSPWNTEIKTFNVPPIITNNSIKTLTSLKRMTSWRCFSAQNASHLMCFL